MALFGKDDRPPRPEEAPSGPTTISASAPARAERGVQAHLGVGSRIEGKLTFDGSVQIDGQVDGEIHAQDSILIGDKAVINATVLGGTVIIKGKVTGDVTARTRIELQAPAKLTGNIATPSLVIHDGVIFEGRCTMAAEGKGQKDKDSKVAFFNKEAGDKRAEGNK